MSYFSSVSGSTCCDSNLHRGCTLVSLGRGRVRLGWKHGGGLAWRKLGEEKGGDWGRGYLKIYLQLFAEPTQKRQPNAGPKGQNGNETNSGVCS